MKRDDIKNYAARCDSGIITHQMIMDRLHDEIEELRDYIETKSKPLTDEEIDKVTDAQWGQNNNKPIYAAHRAYARAIERAHGIGEKE